MYRLILSIAVLAAVQLLCVAGPATAELIAADNFESYTLGTIIGQGAAGGGWDGAYSGLNPNSTGGTSLRSVVADVIAGFGQSLEVGPLTVGTSNSTNNNVVQRSFTAQTGTVYVGLVLKTVGFDTGGSGSFLGDFFQVYINNTSNTSGTSGSQGTSLSGGMDFDTAPNEGKYMVRKGGEQTLSSLAHQNDSVYQLVIKISKSGATANYDEVSLFVNQATEGTPDAARGVNDTQAITLTTLSKLHMRIFGMELNDRVYLDELRIATTYAEAIPEPSVAVLLLAGGGLLAALRRKMRGLR